MTSGTAAATARGVVRTLVEEYNARRLEPLLDLYHEDARFWDPFHREGVVGRVAIRELLAGLFASFPDERMAIRTLAADDDYAVAEFRSTGTDASGREFSLDFTEVYELRDGRIASCRVYLDPEEIPAQAGEGGAA